MSDDGAYAFVVIALLGNPFSPAYAAARELGPATPTEFCAMNVSIYGRGVRRWALTESAVQSHDRAATFVNIAASRMAREGDHLVVHVDERTAPFGRKITGRIVFEPSCAPGTETRLDARGEHTWWPVASRGRVKVELREPALRFEGHGYHDANAGCVPLEASFAEWSWSRAPLSCERAVVTYDVVERSGEHVRRAWLIDDGGSSPIDVPTRSLRQTRWFRLDRAARGDDVRIVRELEDTPFYARALVETRIHGETTTAMHETLSLDRFRTRWVRALLGYRMKRFA